jgi:hypothetical protein
LDIKLPEDVGKMHVHVGIKQPHGRSQQARRQSLESGQGFMREGAVERVINLSQRHAASQAFEGQRDRRLVPRIASFPPRSRGAATIHL